MKFITKFNMNDEVWFMKDNKPTRANITSVDIHHSRGGACNGIKYTATDYINPKTWLDHQNLFERDLYSSKEELIKSL